ncbi:hypothetical protein [Glutamicibacter nicotianae]|uniref:ApeA N-terminal domain 1-containing protein n=1 Tax=Glutamicibacter nicotianae TaxID=37929 RepID=UPI0025530845|nr:hypothetical protein [Glutamicibacter nicotianae]WIV44712.1 hypothetical protein QQS42_03640 [Glutamicibacter nicotianae]
MNIDLRDLNYGDVVVGLIVDGKSDTPSTAATLQVTEDRGIVLEIPYSDHPDMDQFRHVVEWFNKQSPPENLLLETIHGNLTLFNIRWAGYKESMSQTLGRLKPHEVLIGSYAGDLIEPLLIESTRSRIDGLPEWTSIQALDLRHETDSQGLLKDLTINAKSTQSDSWQQGDATLHFASDWRTTRPNQRNGVGLNIDADTVLVSSFPTPRSFREHFEEQRKVVDLITLTSGQALSFREHKVAPRGRSGDLLIGPAEGKSHLNLLSNITIEEQREKLFDHVKFQQHLLCQFDTVGVAGLTCWSKNYATWSKKFIYPATALFKRERPFAEDVVNTLSMAIEAAGNLIGVRDGEDSTYKIIRGGKKAPGAATQVYRCLHATGYDWSDFSPTLEGLARGINDTYNATKHFNKGEYPEPEVLAFVSVLLRYLVRLLSLRLADSDGSLLEPFKGKKSLLRLHNQHKHFGVSFDSRGRPVPSINLL